MTPQAYQRLRHLSFKRRDPLDRVKAALAEQLYEVHKVSLDESDLAFHALLLGILLRPLDLERVVVHADDLDVREACDGACRPTDATPDVEDAKTRSEGDLKCEIVLVCLRV